MMAGFLTVPAQAEIINFDDTKTGNPPPGWTATKTGSGSAMWTIAPRVLGAGGHSANKAM